MREAVESVQAYKGKHSFDIIITDDGSSDISTLNLLSALEQQGIKIIYQENKGPAAARNTGVKSSDSTYILFLDSDNKIMPAYIDEGIAALEQNKKAAVAYGNANFINAGAERDFKTDVFDIKRMLIENYIDTCSVVRKEAWESVDGMDEERLLIGHEDWEFWISLFKAGWEFIYINKTLFEYRVAEASLITKTSKEDFYNKLAYIHKKHWRVFYEAYLHLYGQYLIYKADIKRPVRSFFKYIKHNVFKN